jgi:trehalose 6-phosphate phosphatase
MRHVLSELDSLDRALAGAERVFIATGFDGTLCPIAESPGGVMIPAAMQTILNRLIGSDRVVLAILSGRTLIDLMSRVPIPAIFGGDHGLEIRGPDVYLEHPEARRLRPLLTAACHDLKLAVARWAGAWVEEKNLTATVHFRRVDPVLRQSVARDVRHAMGRFGLNFGMRAGDRTIEVHPRVGWNKGAAVTWIRQKLRLQNDPCICIGRDPTDEAMFLANANQTNIRVGACGRTATKLYVSEPFEVGAVLSHIAAIMQVPQVHGGTLTRQAAG